MSTIQNNEHKTLLQFAGKVALAARLVTTANAKNLSCRIAELEIALDKYDNEIIQFEENNNHVNIPRR